MAQQDCIATLLQLLGKPAGAEFSSEDVSLLFSKVFHVPSNSSEAHAAMKKVAGHNSCWSCADGNLLDVLVEMEKEREKKEMVQTLYTVPENYDGIFKMMDDIEQSTDPKYVYNSEAGLVQIQTSEKNCPEGHMESVDPCFASKERVMKVMDGQQFYVRDTSRKRLKKAARQCWTRLASEGVKSMLPPPWQVQNTGFRAQSWGCVTLSDVLLLVEVKYDVVKQLLFTEMLQEHYSNNVWEKLLPWQKQKEVEILEELAEEALESADMICLAMLPGAFKMYKVCLDASEQSVCRSTEQSRTAVSLLNELQTLCQQEQHTLTDLTKRLCSEDPILLCLHIRLATLRAQRENMSYNCLLAAQQSWKTWWPKMSSSCRAEQVALWLDGEEEEEEKEDLKTLQQKAALQLLVLSQEQERKHLIRIIHEICQEESEGLDSKMLSKEVSDSGQVTLKDECLKMLKQIHAQLQTPSEVQGEQPQFRPQDCAPPMLIHLTELQEVQALTLLQALADRNPDRIQTLRDKYIDEIQTQRFSSLLHLLSTDWMQFLHPNLTGNSSKDQSRPQSSCSPDEGHGSRASAEAPGADAIKSDVNEVPTAGDKKELCSDCGAVIEDLPYLEISCASDVHEETPDGSTVEEGAYNEESSATVTPESYEKQESLITLAWSKQADCDTDCQTDAANLETGQSPDLKDSEMTPILPAQSRETVQQGDGDVQESALAQCGSLSLCDTQSTEQGTTEEQRQKADQAVEGDNASEKDQKTFATKEENFQDMLAELSGEADDLDSGRSSPIADAGREMSGVEHGQTETKLKQCDVREPEISECEEMLRQEPVTECMLSVSKPQREQTLVEKERMTEPVSMMEREKTMRNLVDIQRKVEQKQQRDRERQLLRVQERLSIIQNRKAEGDLLGIKHTDRLKHLTKDLPKKDKIQQKAAVRERLEQVRRERSSIMQSKRDRNTAGFKELLAPVTHHKDIESGSD